MITVILTMTTSSLARKTYLAAIGVLVCLVGWGACAYGIETADTTTLKGKVLCGYQGWFRCPGDRAGMGWIHWSGDSKQIVPQTLTFEMWPDMTEYSAEERYGAPGFSYPDGTPASLFSAENGQTVRRHFEWMAQYGIHGAWLQHFVVDLPGGPNESRYASRMRVLGNVREAAAATGRVWALAYDMAGMPSETLFAVMTSEWKELVDGGLTRDPRYLHHDGKPVLMVWGFYPRQNITPELANRIIDFFKSDPNYGVFLCGGCEWEWRTDKTPGWAAFLRRFDLMSPWNIGNYTKDASGTKWASTGYWKEDLEEARRVGMLYLPVVYPGFGWDNMKKLPAGQSAIPRNGGRFLWKQYGDVAALGIDMAYAAMFDEVDEGTAIFKVTNHPPTQAHFTTYEGLPADHYLWLTGEGIKMLQGRGRITAELPRRP